MARIRPENLDRPAMTRFKYDATCARAVAVLGLLDMLNAFVQSTDWLAVPELVIGAIWLGACAVIPRWLNAWGIVAVSFVAPSLGR